MFSKDNGYMSLVSLASVGLCVCVLRECVSTRTHDGSCVDVCDRLLHVWTYVRVHVCRCVHASYVRARGLWSFVHVFVSPGSRGVSVTRVRSTHRRQS